MNSAFVGVTPFILQYLQLPTMLPILRNIVMYHIVPNTVLYSVNIPAGMTILAASNNATLTVINNTGVITVNNANITQPDVLAANGVIQVLNNVTVPPGTYDFGLLNALYNVNATAFLGLIAQSSLGPYFVSSVPSSPPLLLPQQN